MEGLRLHKSATHRQSNKVNTRLQIMAYRIYLNNCSRTWGCINFRHNKCVLVNKPDNTVDSEISARILFLHCIKRHISD